MNTLQHSTKFQDSPIQTATIRQSLVVIFFAHLFSFIFHPLFIPVYVTYYLAFIDPGYFNGITDTEKVWVLLRVTINMVFFPLVSVFLLRGVGFIDSIFLKTQRDRIIPYIISNVFFFWMFLVFRHQAEIPSILTAFVFSVFISSSLALLANIYFKISMHATGVGGLLGLMVIILFSNNLYPVTLPFAIALLITGIVCTARMIVSDHSQKDIYGGLILGAICQIIGAYFIW